MVIKRLPVALLLMCFVAAGCATSGGVESEATRKAAESNAESHWKPAADDDLQLAVEVEIRADGLTPMGATVVRAPRKTNSAIADLSVRATGASGPTGEYAMADPRLAEVDRSGEQILQSARSFVFAPLTPDLTTIEVRPLTGAKRAVSRGGTIDARPLLWAACEKEREIPTCIQVLRTQPR
jgi:hypothetical protein